MADFDSRDDLLLFLWIGTKHIDSGDSRRSGNLAHERGWLPRDDWMLQGCRASRSHRQTLQVTLVGRGWRTILEAFGKVLRSFLIGKGRVWNNGVDLLFGGCDGLLLLDKFSEVRALLSGNQRDTAT